MARFIITNDVVEPITIKDDFLQETFPAAVYAVKKSLKGFYLQYVEDKFDMPGKIYGTAKKRSKKVMKAFNRRPNTTGVLLTGPKGTGKSLLAKVISNKAIEQGIPVIRIQDPWVGEQFNTFIQELGECVLLFDEFAKVYYDDENEVDLQQELLSLFDGVSSSKKLCILTENKYNQIDDLFKNRPSRVLYSWQYTNVEEGIIDGYCDDNLENKKHKKDIIELAGKTDEFSFDVLQALVDECNANDEPFKKIIDDLNLDITRLTEFFEIKTFNAGNLGKRPSDPMIAGAAVPKKRKKNKKSQEWYPVNDLIRIKHEHLAVKITDGNEVDHLHFNLQEDVIGYDRGMYTLKGPHGTVITGIKIMAPESFKYGNAF